MSLEDQIGRALRFRVHVLLVVMPPLLGALIPAWGAALLADDLAGETAALWTGVLGFFVVFTPLLLWWRRFLVQSAERHDEQ